MAISITTKAQLVYLELKNKIIEGVLEPGTHLIIKQLATEYGVSDIPVREALKELASEGLIQTIPHIGSRVVGLSVSQFKDMLEMRECLEPFAAELAAANADGALIATLEGYCTDAALALEKGDIIDYGEINTIFHQTLFSYSKNQILIDTITTLVEAEKRMRKVFEIFPEILKDSHKEHCEMVELLRKNDRESMRQLMYLHKKRSFDKMRRHFHI